MYGCMALKWIYISMIRPFLEYGDIFYDNCSQIMSNKLEKIQRRAAIACTGAYRHISYQSLLNELNWHSLSSPRQSNRLIQNYKITKNLTPSYLHTLLPTPHSTSYSLSNRTLSSFFPATTRDLNCLPEATRDTNSLPNFKRLNWAPNNHNPYHRICSSKCEIWLSRIWMGQNALNSHRHNNSFIDSPNCQLCHTTREDQTFLLWVSYTSTGWQIFSAFFTIGTGHWHKQEHCPTWYNIKWYTDPTT